MYRASRKSLVQLLLVAVIGLCVQAIPVRVFAGTRAPLEGVGDLAFTADFPVFLDTAGRPRLDLAVRIDHGELDGGAINAAQRFVLGLKLAREGEVAIDTTQVFYVEIDPTGFSADAIARYELLEMSLPVRPGRWAVSLDLSAPSRMFERKARATGVLDVPGLGAAGVTLSDPEFRIASGQSSVPNPARIYGVVQDTLDVYWEISGIPPEGVHAIEVAVSDPRWGTMHSQPLQLEMAPGGLTAHQYRLPLGDFPQGNYVLELKPAWDPERLVEAEFLVSWEISRVVQGGDDLRLEAELVLGPEQFLEFETSSRSGQAAMLLEFWEWWDPSPETERNELREKFLARVDHARRFFGDHERPGPLTDRGRVYVKYGAPSQVEVKVLPSNGADLDEAIESVHESFAPQVEGVLAREAVEAGDHPAGLKRAGRSRDADVLRDRRRNQARIGQEGSFEVWFYTSSGDPLFEDAGWSRNLDLRFLFVDRMGTGLYRLEYSSLPQLD